MELPIGPMFRRSMSFPTRQPLLVGLPAEFMEKWNMVPEDMDLDPKLGRFRFREEKLSINTVSTSNELKDQMNRTGAAIEAYEKYGKIEFKTRWQLDATGSWNWENVLKEMKAAVEAYEGLTKVDKDSKSHRCRVSMHKCFRSFSNNATSFQDWLAVIPAGDYGAVFCGSLQMIFKAAAKLGRIRDDVMEALSEMPETIAMVRSYGHIYTNFVRMRHVIYQFEVATLMALEKSLVWLTEKPVSKYIGSLRKQSAYGTDLDAAFGAFKKSVKKLNDMATLTLHEVNKDSNLQVRKGRIEQAQNTLALANIGSEVQGVKFEQAKLNARQDLLNEQQEKLTNLQEITNTLLVQLSCNPRLKEVDYHHSRQQRAAIAQDKDDDEYSEENMAFPQIKVLPAVHRKALLRHIGNLFINQARCDIETAIISAPLMSFGEQDRQGYMTESNILRDFLSSAESSAVLIQGNSPHDDAITSTSVYAASLVTALQRLHVSVIYFACGLHSTPYLDDPFIGPYGMMLGLLQQLLEVYPLDHLTFSDHNILRHQFANVQSIGRLMHLLVSNEPRTSTTFCVIDGISFFENSTCEADTHEAIFQLLGIASRANGCFKLLITSPTRSIYVPRSLMNYPFRCDVLDIPPEIVNGRRQGVRPSTLAQTMSDDIVQSRPIPPW